MSYASVNGLELYYETHGSGSGRPLVLLHGGLMTIELNFSSLLAPLAAGRPVIAVELQGHGHTADTSRPMTIPALAGDIIALLDELGIERADFFGFSLGGLVTCAVAASAPERVGRLVIASADPHRPPGRESVPLDEARLPTQADFQAMVGAYRAAAPDPDHFEELMARNNAMVHQVAAWPDEQVRALRAPVLLIFGDRDFWLLPDIAELFALLPDVQLAVLPGTTHMGVGRHPALHSLVPRFLDAG
jgi:pimeloyl-ACP methyl ester carboxylesterase